MVDRTRYACMRACLQTGSEQGTVSKKGVEQGLKVRRDEAGSPNEKG